MSFLLSNTVSQLLQRPTIGHYFYGLTYLPYYTNTLTKKKKHPKSQKAQKKNLSFSSTNLSIVITKENSGDSRERSFKGREEMGRLRSNNEEGTDHLKLNHWYQVRELKLERIFIKIKAKINFLINLKNYYF